MNGCICGDENPYKRCSCNSRSEEPCAWCDWWTGHTDCEDEYCADCGSTKLNCECPF